MLKITNIVRQTYYIPGDGDDLSNDLEGCFLEAILPDNILYDGFDPEYKEDIKEYPEEYIPLDLGVYTPTINKNCIEELDFLDIRSILIKEKKKINDFIDDNTIVELINEHVLDMEKIRKKILYNDDLQAKLCRLLNTGRLEV